jgi:hypothetical protein
MNKKSIKAFSAKVTFGLEREYFSENIDKKVIIQYLRNSQEELIKKKIYLSASIYEATVVMSGQQEPHLVIGFINYPKFPLAEDVLKNEIEILTKNLMHEFQQNRVVIEYLDETIMFEKTNLLDPLIKRS